MELKSVDDTSISSTNKKGKDTQTVPYVLYRKRWLMLFLFFIYCISSLIHTIQYSVIANVMVKYYTVSYHAVEWTAMIFSTFYILFSIPGSILLDKLGLRISVLIGVLGTCLGSWMKVVAVHPDRFWLVLLSQCIIATFSVFVLPVPPKLAAVWFGSNEVALACTLAAIATQIGTTLGIVIPPLLVLQGDIETMEAGFHKMTYGWAIITTVITVALYFLFDDAPATPPSFAQQEVQENKKVSFDYKTSLLKVIKNKSFVLLLLIYGVHTGMSIAVPVLLNEMILTYHPGASEQVSYIGLTMSCSGIVGSLIYGIAISEFGRLKFLSWFFYISATIATVLYVFLIDQELPVVYFLAALAGVFWNCIYCVGFELGVELTYPEPETTAGGALTNSFQLFSVIMTYLYSYFYNDVNKLFGNLVLLVILLTADVLIFFIKFDLKRSEAEQSKTNNPS